MNKLHITSRVQVILRAISQYPRNTCFKNFVESERRLKAYMNMKYKNMTKGIWRAILVAKPSRSTNALLIFDHMNDIRYGPYYV